MGEKVRNRVMENEKQLRADLKSNLKQNNLKQDIIEDEPKKFVPNNEQQRFETKGDVYSGDFRADEEIRELKKPKFENHWAYNGSSNKHALQNMHAFDRSHHDGLKIKQQKRSGKGKFNWGDIENNKEYEHMSAKEAQELMDTNAKEVEGVEEEEE